jgi:hypothetical protein
MPTAAWINSFHVFTKLFSVTNSLMRFGRSFLANKVPDIAHLPQQCHNSKCVTLQERLLKVLKCYNFLRVQWRHNSSPAARFANCVMTLYLLTVHLQTFLSIPITQKCRILSCDTLVANERYVELTTYCHLVLSLRIHGTPLHDVLTA